MKQLTCEMCGSTDLLKQDGVFVCQSCGCKYSVEEAKRMMIEGTVDVQGTVKIDNSAFVEKYLQNARRAKEKEDWEEVEKYYNMVEQNDPNNIEAIFYSAYGKAKTTLTGDDIYKRQAAFKVLTNCISIIDDKYQIKRREENKKAIISMADDLGSMICSNFVFTEWKNGYGTVTKTNKVETIKLFGSLLDAFKESIENIQKVDDQPYLHEVAIKLYSVAKTTGYWTVSLINGWISEEKNRLKVIVFEIMAEENEGKNVTELLNVAYENLSNYEGLLAQSRFETIIKQCPNEKIGYIGKSVALAIQNSDCDVIFEPILIATDKNNSAEFVEETKKLVNHRTSDIGITLLMLACAEKDLDAVRALIDMGADINMRSDSNTTALWQVAFKTLPPERANEGREIARILIDMDADLDVTNTGGVALYNSDTDYQIVQMITEKNPDILMGDAAAKPKTGGCYVATCVYGSYDCPSVWTLRRYRDEMLASTWYGRAFIHTYYAISPTLVKWFGDMAWFKKIWKGTLDKMVDRLQANGIEDAPYQDTKW